MNQTSYRRRIDAVEKTALSELFFIYAVPVIYAGGQIDFLNLAHCVWNRARPRQYASAPSPPSCAARSALEAIGRGVVWCRAWRIRLESLCLYVHTPDWRGKPLAAGQDCCRPGGDGHQPQSADVSRPAGESFGIGDVRPRTIWECSGANLPCRVPRHPRWAGGATPESRYSFRGLLRLHARPLL